MVHEVSWRTYIRHNELKIGANDCDAESWKEKHPVAAILLDEYQQYGADQVPEATNSHYRRTTDSGYQSLTKVAPEDTSDGLWQKQNSNVEWSVKLDILHV